MKKSFKQDKEDIINEAEQEKLVTHNSGSTEEKKPEKIEESLEWMYKATARNENWTTFDGQKSGKVALCIILYDNKN